MRSVKIAVVAQSYRDFPSFGAKLEEAAQWLAQAGADGADLVVFPEYMNCYRGDGPGNPLALTLEEAALGDWKVETEILFDAAARHGVDFVLPLIIRGKEFFRNCLFVIGSNGDVLGSYDKMQPTQWELDKGILPGENQQLIPWRGLQLGGAICFDTNFDEVFRSQSRLGADMFVVPSLWQGGSFLGAYATQFVAPIALAYPAWSKIIDVDGITLAEGGYRSETLRFGFGHPVFTASINFNRIVLHADGNADKIPELQKKYGWRLQIRFYEEDSRFIVTSHDETLDVQDVAREFDLVKVRNYLSAHKMWR